LKEQEEDYPEEDATAVQSYKSFESKNADRIRKIYQNQKVAGQGKEPKATKPTRKRSSETRPKKKQKVKEAAPEDQISVTPSFRVCSQGQEH